ncbi:MAG: AAA family ATPase [Dehalococcoidales bacterium]|nr:AAA family ATPase [Dehalococcoidales bacterium]
MSIKKLIVSNFRSFDNIDVDLHDLNVVIGANASGKSNFIQIFKFLKDVSEFGLDNAISMQGGAEYLLNTTLGTSQEFSIEVISNDLIKYYPSPYRARGIGCEAIETSYTFTLNFGVERKRLEIVKDVLRQKCKFYMFTGIRKGLTKGDYLGDGTIIIDSSKRTPRFSFQLPTGVREKDFLANIFELQYLERFSTKTTLKSKELYVNSATIFPSQAIMMLKSLLQGVGTYDFDARQSKKPQLITGRVELESDGCNLAVAINHLLKNRNKKQKFYNIIGDLLPFVEGFRIQNIADTVLFTLRERHTQSAAFPAFLLSDGTINLTSLIICLFFEDKLLKIIEEPERHIHPRLVSKVMDLMKEASRKVQIITTTHNPEVVRHSNLDDLLLINRSKNGFSKLSRPIDTERVRAFLKEEMGIEELYIQNLL